MCGGGGGGSNDALRYQQQQDRERKARIAEGEAQLDEMFSRLEGGRYTGDPRNEAATLSYDEYSQRVKDILASNTAMYLENGMPLSEHPLGSLGYGGSSLPLRLSRAEKRLTPQGWQAFKDLGLSADAIGSIDHLDYMSEYGAKDWYDNPVQSAPVWEEHGQAYLDFANPQLDRQFADARGDLTYALSRAGQTQGSVAGDRRSDLELDYGLRQQDVAQTAQEYENTAKANVASQKQNAYQMLSATANPGAATKAAQASLNALQATPSLSPLGMVFQNATAGLAGAVPAYQSGQQNARVNNIVYSRDPNQGSASIVN